MLPEVGELVFSFVVGYMGVLEFLYVVRHLYHWSFGHSPEMRDLKSEAESLQKLQDQLRNAIAEASAKEAMGLKAMKDGVLYKDGFRVNADQKKIEELKEKVRKQEQAVERQREIEAELARQKKIEEETRKKLKEAEDELRRVEEEKEREQLRVQREKEEADERRRKEEEENKRRIIEAERKKEEEQRRLEEEENARKLQEESARKILEDERDREERQRQLELEEENNRKLLEAERQREEGQRQEEENARKLLEAEREREERQRQLEIEEENARKLLEAERQREETQRQEEENARKLFEAERQQEERQRQLEIEEENARKLLEAERQRQLEIEEENARKLLEAEKEREERQREERQRQEEENARKLLEAEKEREERQKQLEIDEENARKLLEAEREQEERQRQEEENTRKLLEAEREEEERQRQQELEDEEIIRRLLEAERKREEEEEAERLREFEEENTRKLLEAERELQEEQRRLEEEQNRQRIEEEENYRRLLQMEREMEERERLAEEDRIALLEHAAGLERETAAELKQRQIEENEENMRQLLEAERELELKKQEMEEEAESLRQLIEAEKAMEERQRRLDEEALQKLKNAQEEIELRQTYDVESEPAVKEEISRSEHSPTPTTVKTQYGQTGGDSLKPKSLSFPGVSEESSSAEPFSSQQSSFSTQQSSEALVPEMHFEEYERQAPDGGEDLPSLQYSDDYLRSLDGIKNKSLVREDGSGRRRAFKKRRSSGSSTSSRESRASREEELKMFTSLEEEELENIRKGENDYEGIKYASEPNLKVSKQHRRHKRSPAKDSKRDAADAAKGSLEMLDEEDSNPWGEVKLEHYKDTEFWKREKHLSIDEELEETDANQRVQSPSLEAVNIPKMSSFEEATKSQHEEAISALQRQRSKDPEPVKEEESDTKNVSRLGDARLSPAGSNSSLASASASISPALISPERENSQETEDAAAARTPSPSSTGGGLRRSPRVDEMRQYKEKWKSEDRKARVDAGKNPAIEIDYASDDEPIAPDEAEYLMEGISDFYDFNASINPSRSRSRSRSKTPAVNRLVSPHQRRTPSPQNLSHSPATTKSRSPSPDPASYKFIYQRILPSLAADQQDVDGLSDFDDFNSKLNREALTGVTTTQRSNEVHRTSVDYVMEDLKDDKGVIGAGAIAKQIDELQRTPTTPDYERSISAEWRDTQKLKEELLSATFKRSTYVGESMDFSDQFESLREEAKTFRRSRSKSRSPGYDMEEITAKVLAKKELQQKILEDMTKTSENLEDFSCDITKSYVDRNRRASDTVLIQKPEILFQIQDLIQESDENLDMLELESEEYHHFRRFSLNQEIPIEQYPEDYVVLSEIQVKSLVDLRTWAGDMESPTVDEVNPPTEDPKPPEDVVEEAYESGSDDERQTVVEVDDEIDEDIWDYNERPEESHNEQSECEEADREMDRYAGRHADDWRDVEGAVGGVLDEDSFQIDQIYDEAIKNRKPSGILRDYDTILQEIQTSDEDRLDEERILTKDTVSNGNSYLNVERTIWSPRSRSSRASSGESSRSFLENERRDNERRYLGDATMEAINSTRLRSRYGIVPSTSFTTTYDDDTTEIDINYVPKKEYNWRKNFKLDDEDGGEEKENHMQYLDSRKFSLGGESITLFSQSPEHQEDGDLRRVHETDEDAQEQLEEEMEQEPEELAIEKPSKKKKNKRKSRKGSRGSIGGNDEEKANASRRNSIVAESDLPKKKSRKETSTVTESQTVDAGQHDVEIEEDSQPKKKSKKRRKAKQESVLPTLEIRLPSPEKKPPPPSVAAIRAALTAPPVEVKRSVSPREVKSPVPLRQSPKIELQPSPPIVRTSISPTPIIPNGEPNRLRSKTPEPSHSPAQSSSTPTKPDQNQNKGPPKTSPVPDAYDIIKDGGLYPLF